VVIGAMRDALELAEAWSREREAIFNVARAGAGLGVVGEFVAVVLAQLEVVAGQADRLPPRKPRVAPVGVPLLRAVGRDEKLDFHLLELARTEGEVARRHLVAERLADLA